MSLRAQLAEFDKPIKDQLSWAVRHISPGLREDAMQEARIGYLKALERFDASRSASFQTFVDARLRGAVQDFLRVVDPLSRKHRLDVRTGEAHEVRRVSECALAATPDGGISPEHQAIARQALDLIGLAKGMGRRVLVRMYVHGETMTAAAETLGLKVPNAHQHRLAALGQIRRALETPNGKKCKPELTASSDRIAA